MKIGGIIDISTKDIPHKSAMVLFTTECNFNCGFCHNKYLLQPNVGRIYSIKDLLKKISSNLLVSSVSISGGEPTLQDDLPELCEEIKKIGKYISIDTNGSDPAMIQVILPYINRVALDLKGPLDQKKYEKITGVSVDIDMILTTIEILKNQSELDFEIRTTYSDNILSPEDLEEIFEFLTFTQFKGNFVLQQYQYLDGVGEPFKDAFNKPSHDALIEILKPYKAQTFPFQVYLRDELVGYKSINELSL